MGVNALVYTAVPFTTLASATYPWKYWLLTVLPPTRIRLLVFVKVTVEVVDESCTPFKYTLKLLPFLTKAKWYHWFLYKVAEPAE